MFHVFMKRRRVSVLCVHGEGGSVFCVFMKRRRVHYLCVLEEKEGACFVWP